MEDAGFKRVSKEFAVNMCHDVCLVAECVLLVFCLFVVVVVALFVCILGFGFSGLAGMGEGFKGLANCVF